MHSEQSDITLVQSPQSHVPERSNGPNRCKIPYRMRAVLDMHMAGVPAHEIAEACGYNNVGSVYQVLKNEKVKALMQERMDYYDSRFKMLYPLVIEGVEMGLRSTDEKVVLEAGKIWLKSHGKDSSNYNNNQNNISAETIVNNILVQVKQEQAQEQDEPPIARSDSNRKLIPDSRQEKTTRRFYIEPEPEKVRSGQNK